MNTHSMHQTASTSREAYRSLDAKDQYDAILGYLRSIAPESSCIADIGHVLGMERSTVSGRLNELKHMEPSPILYDGKKPSQRTGITAYHWRIRPAEEQPVLPGMPVITRTAKITST